MTVTTADRRWPSEIRKLEGRTMPAPEDAAGLSADELVTSHLPLVGYLVNEISSKLPAHVAREDLHSAGLVGLVQAAAAYDPARGVPFRRYASTRIRGAMVDELRSADWVSRSVRQRGRRRDEAIAQLSVVLGRNPAQSEVAEFLGCSVAELDHVEEDLHRTVVLSLDASPDPDSMTGARPDTDATPEESLLRNEELSYLAAAVEALPERLQTVVQMYFLQGRQMAEIATVLGVSESRVSQMRGEALLLLRDGMNSQLDPDHVSRTSRPGGCVDRRRAAYFAAIAEKSTYGLHRDGHPDETGAAPAAGGATAPGGSPLPVAPAARRINVA